MSLREYARALLSFVSPLFPASLSLCLSISFSFLDPCNFSHLSTILSTIETAIEQRDDSFAWPCTRPFSRHSPHPSRHYRCSQQTFNREHITDPNAIILSYLLLFCPVLSCSLLSCSILHAGMFQKSRKFGRMHGQRISIRQWKFYARLKGTYVRD